MPVPNRSDLPRKFVELIDQQNKEFAEREHILPLLPAEVTPPEIVEAAKALDASIKKHLAERSIAAEWLEQHLRPLIDSALAGTLTETVDSAPPDRLCPGYTNDIGINQRQDLRDARHNFSRYITGSDELRPEDYEGLRRIALKARKFSAANHWDLDLDLTDEEWWAI